MMNYQLDFNSRRRIINASSKHLSPASASLKIKRLKMYQKNLIKRPSHCHCVHPLTSAVLSGNNSELSWKVILKHFFFFSFSPVLQLEALRGNKIPGGDSFQHDRLWETDSCCKILFGYCNFIYLAFQFALVSAVSAALCDVRVNSIYKNVHDRRTNTQ